jgi:hypothetical protein
MAMINKPPMMDRVIMIARRVVSDFVAGDGDGDEDEDEDEVDEVGEEGMQFQ